MGGCENTEGTNSWSTGRVCHEFRLRKRLAFVYRHRRQLDVTGDIADAKNVLHTLVREYSSTGIQPPGAFQCLPVAHARPATFGIRPVANATWSPAVSARPSDLPRDSS
jgi:hypothetical protein